MYKVTYYIGNLVKTKDFETLNDACEFVKTIAVDNVLEIKLYKEQVKKEDRT